MELRLFNTLTKEKEAFAPLDPARGVRMYVCGPTVYDFAHIGNARPVIVFDVLYRLLRHLYGQGKVKYVRNITDVDDKINARAAEEYPELPLNEAIRLVTEKTEKQFHDDVDALGCLRPDVEPRATEHIGEMRELIDRLVKTGFAYVEQDHVLFEVGKMADYGKLARRSLDEMEAGARVEVAPYKRNPMDFVLWKPSKPNEPGWPSPSGIKTPGRPGWHIECSAMSWKHLGETFDIHGGGIDLVFPHHENEIAQSRCAFHAPVMAKTWMHNGFLQVEGEKMSKSLGNFVTIRELLTGWKAKPWAGQVIRFAMLQTHYREPIDWTLDHLEKSRIELATWCREIDPNKFSKFDPFAFDWSQGSEPSLEVIEALSNDLNTSEAITVLRSFYVRASKGDEEARIKLLMNSAFLGLVQKENVRALNATIEANYMRADEFQSVVNMARDFQTHLANRNERGWKRLFDELEKVRVKVEWDMFGGVRVTKSGAKDGSGIEDMIKARNTARANKDWKESDRIRDELKAMGVVIKDNKDGTTTWEIAR